MTDERDGRCGGGWGGGVLTLTSGILCLCVQDDEDEYDDEEMDSG